MCRETFNTGNNSEAFFQHSIPDPVNGGPAERRSERPAGLGIAARQHVCRLRGGARGHPGASPCIPSRRYCLHTIGHMSLSALAPGKLIFMYCVIFVPQRLGLEKLL